MHSGIAFVSFIDSSVGLCSVPCGVFRARQSKCNPNFLSPPLVHFRHGSKNYRLSKQPLDGRCTHRAARLSHHLCVSLPVFGLSNYFYASIGD